MNELEKSFDLVIDEEQLNDGQAPRGIPGVIELAAARFGEALTLEDLAAAAGMPPNTLTRKFNRKYGLSPMRWLWSFRTILAAEFIAAAPEWSLTDVAIYCGFNSSAHFSRRFKEMFQESPSRFRSNFRKGATVREIPPGGGAAAIRQFFQDHSGSIDRVLEKLESLAHRL